MRPTPRPAATAAAAAARTRSTAAAGGAASPSAAARTRRRSGARKRRRRTRTRRRCALLRAGWPLAGLSRVGGRAACPPRPVSCLTCSPTPLPACPGKRPACLLARLPGCRSPHPCVACCAAALRHPQDKKQSKRERSPERPPAEPRRAAGPRAPLMLDDPMPDSKRARHDRAEVRGTGVGGAGGTWLLPLSLFGCDGVLSHGRAGSMTA